MADFGIADLEILRIWGSPADTPVGCLLPIACSFLIAQNSKLTASLAAFG
jgi:hypothetical protein